MLRGISAIQAAGAGVSSLNGLSGALNLIGGTGITITPSGANITIAATGSGTGTVTSVSGTNANGVSWTITNPTTTPNLTITLGAITPSTIVASGNISGANLSGTNTGDQTNITGNAGTATFASTAGTASAVAFSGITSATNTIAAMVVGNGASLAATGTGTIAATTTTALAIARAINGVNFDGTAPITVAAAAGTLTGSTLASGVTASSLTSVGAQVQALNMNSHLINNVTDPVSAQDAATKNYVDLAVATTEAKQECQAATTTALAAATYNNGSSGVGATLTLTVAAVLILDGYTPSLGDRLLIKNQASAFQNGIYTLTTVGTVVVNAVLTRATDFDQPNEIDGALVYILNGTTNGNTLWFCTTTGTVTIGTTNINWSQFLGATYAADGTTLTLTGNTFSVNATFQATLATLTGTQTLTNKQITRRFVTVTQSATPAINTNTTDVASITGLAQAITSMTSSLSGTPTAGQLLEIQITDNGTARGITWGASFGSTTVTLPTTTVISTILRVGVEWNATASLWQCIAVA